MTDQTGPAGTHRPPRRAAGWVVIVIVVALVGLAAVVRLAARSGDGSGSGGRAAQTPAGPAGPGTTAPITPEQGLGEGRAPEQRGRIALDGFGEVVVTITDPSGKTCEVCLLSATDAAQRERGLMEVTDPDLGGYDGMLFEYPDEISGAFWMRNTPMPLSIAYFDGDRTLVSVTDMAPCRDEPTCESYPADGAFRYALEVPQGGLDDLLVVAGATFTIDARTCPLADDAS